MYNPEYRAKMLKRRQSTRTARIKKIIIGIKKQGRHQAEINYTRNQNIRQFWYLVRKVKVRFSMCLVLIFPLLFFFPDQLLIFKFLSRLWGTGVRICWDPRVKDPRDRMPTVLREEVCRLPDRHSFPGLSRHCRLEMEDLCFW